VLSLAVVPLHLPVVIAAHRQYKQRHAPQPGGPCAGAGGGAPAPGFLSLFNSECPRSQVQGASALQHAGM
jgi:hypothetical protein